MFKRRLDHVAKKYRFRPFSTFTAKKEPTKPQALSAKKGIDHPDGIVVGKTVGEKGCVMGHKAFLFQGLPIGADFHSRIPLVMNYRHYSTSLALCQELS